MELERFLAGGRQTWSAITLMEEPEMERDCNAFAAALCGHHNDFNADDDCRRAQLLFPSEMLDAATEEIPRPVSDWPSGYGYDSSKAFWK